MPSVYQAVLRSWSIPPAATFAIVLSALVYLRGWWLLRRAGSPVVPPWRAVTFLLGLFTLWVALASPLDVFNGFVLTAHMLQHMLLMMVVPPLILLGAPLVPMVRGCRSSRRERSIASLGSRERSPTLPEDEAIAVEHVAEAIVYRSLERLGAAA